ncbi:porin [Mycoplana dimorpha]|uniref:Porin n=1 Tax=Mycoplana dimorpha TaxID=28320 RepID=A0A2T5BIJ0_MYCDI|nr:porin [Mycoplana dimorpha]PTM98713.1 porin-like protein [Mycoplana dimorpha]
MNIKSLLLGSAAALAAVSGAQAADAIVAAEPEPMEYVRVCDAFGKGYFYIPGTETCLKIGGYIRVDFNGGDINGQDTDGNGVGDSWKTRSRLSLRLSTASDTEYGALKTYAEVQAQRDDNTGGGTNLAHGYIELGGVLIGYTGTLYSDFTGDAGKTIKDFYDVDYGDFDRTQIRYTYDAGNGFSFAFAVEDDSNTDSKSVADYLVADDNYMPDLVAGIGYNGGAWKLRAVGGYDESMEEGAIKVRGDLSLGQVSLFAMVGWNTDGDFKNNYARWDGDWAAWLGASYSLTEKATLNGSINFDDGDNVEASLNVAYQVVPGFTITPEVNYRSDADEKLGGGAEDWGGVIRFQRNF